MTPTVEHASCSFESCEPSIVERVVVAAVDQLCAQSDIDIALLEALEHPLGESLAALSAFEITRVDIEVDAMVLRVTVHVESDVPEPGVALGDAAVDVESFFEVRSIDDGRGLTLSGSLA